MIEGASGEKYVDFVRENVLQPAGMTHTRVDDRLAIVPDRSRFYSKDKSEIVVNAEPIDVSFKIPADGWLSSAEDMATFEVAMLNNRVCQVRLGSLCGLGRRAPMEKKLPMGLAGKSTLILSLQ